MFDCIYTGETYKDFAVDILHNADVEWHEMLTLVFGPEDPRKAIIGEFSTATITILDHQVSGSLVLPAPPMVQLS